MTGPYGWDNSLSNFLGWQRDIGSVTEALEARLAEEDVHAEAVQGWTVLLICTLLLGVVLGVAGAAAVVML